MILPDITYLAEEILHAQIQDLENLTIWEMTSDSIESHNPEGVPDDFWKSNEYRDFIDTVRSAVRNADVEVTIRL